MVSACNPPSGWSTPLIRDARSLLHGEARKVIHPSVFSPSQEDPPRMKPRDGKPLKGRLED
eukprot:6578254-Alexandrium_andersonii.AAC.1